MQYSPIRLILIGLGGYGGYCYDLLKSYVPSSRYLLCGIIDPVAEKAPHYQEIKEMNIPIYPDTKTFFQTGKADLALIASPIPYHCEQAVDCMQHGVSVLCEKPITATLQDCEKMAQAAKETKTRLAVGFQWSFADPILQAKTDILTGRYGRPLRMRAYISWKRYDEYYQNGWKGCIADSQGRWILDTVASNATAHYLHNLYFMLGDRLETSAMPEKLQAMLLRAKNIETYDTCLLKGRCAGADILYIATHSADYPTEPTLIYEFEKGTITMNLHKPGQVLYGNLDGEIIAYGNPQCHSAVAQKIEKMIDAIVFGFSIPCLPETVRPHLATVNGLMEQCPIHPFPSQTFREKDRGTFVHGLNQQLLTCFQQFRFPYPGEWDWAFQPTELHLDDYYYFSGVYHD